MTNETRSPQPGERDSESERALRALFARAEPREAPPAADTEEIRSAVYAEWDQLTGRRVWLRRAGAVAAAGALAVVAAWAVLDIGTGPTGPAVAYVERLQGTVEDALQLGGALAQGTTLSTGTGQVALRLAAGGSLRLGPRTRIELAANGAELVAGQLYFDSEGERADTEPFTITTQLGTLRDVGTQFMARLDDERFEVGVRDGRVALQNDADSSDAAAGEKLVVAEGAKTIRRDNISTFGPDWAWAERLAPPFDIDGRRLIDFLTWVAEQTGRTVVFADAATEQTARETTLSGSIDLAPMPKLTAVLALTNLGFAIDGDRLLIDTK